MSTIKILKNCPECGEKLEFQGGISCDGWTAGRYGAIDTSDVVWCPDIKCAWAIDDMDNKFSSYVKFESNA